MYPVRDERLYNGFGETKAEAFNNAMTKAVNNDEPESVLEMLYDCQNILKSENDFVHMVSVEYTRLNCSIRGLQYECMFYISRL